MSQLNCPHCDARLRFKRLPSHSVNCPNCDELIGLADLQRQAHSTVILSDSNPARAIPTNALVETADAMSTETADLQPAHKPIKQQTSADWEHLEKPEVEPEPNLLKEGLITLAVGAGLFLYGRSGGEIAFLHISHGFLYGFSVILLVAAAMMLISTLNSILRDGYESDFTDKVMLMRPVIFVIIVALLWYHGYLRPPASQPVQETSAQTVQNPS